MYNLYQINHTKFKNIVKIYISCQVLHKQQEAKLLLSNAEIFLQFIIRLKSFRVGAFLSELANLDYSNGPKYRMECLPYMGHSHLKIILVSHQGGSPDLDQVKLHVQLLYKAGMVHYVKAKKRVAGKISSLMINLPNEKQQTA